jgi:hypothetical protein
MTQLILNLQNDMEASGETMTSSLPEASLNYASPTQPQENALAKKMRDTSGQRCLEQYGKFNRHGLWAKTFSDLLIGMEGWYSKRCRLTWKLKGTKSNRMYFQLYPSTLPTEGIESGLLPTPKTMDVAESINSGKKLEYKNGVFTNVRKKDGMRFGASLNDIAYAKLLPTPQAMDCMTNPPRQITESGRIISNQGHNGSAPLKDLAMSGLLPTPTAMDSTNATANMKSTQVKEGSMNSVTLMRAMSMGILPTPKVGGKEGYETRAKRQGHEKAISHLEAFVEFHTMLPTPATRDYKGARSTEALEKSGRSETNSLPDAFHQSGLSSQLSPQFVLEMMGFPTDWTLLPFLNGETNQSKQEATQ